MIILTLDIQLGGHLQDGCQCFMDHLTPDLLVIVKSGHGQPHSGHGEPGDLVHVLYDSVPLLPALAPQVPLEPRWGVTPGHCALQLHLRARGGLERAAKW